MTGQDAVNTAKAFNERLNFDGVVLTKLDGDTRGGAALTAQLGIETAIKFIGTSEKMDEFGCFSSRSYGQSYFGYGRCHLFGRACTATIR